MALSEGGIGWMPWMLERIDYVWERHRHYTGCNPDVRPVRARSRTTSSGASSPTTPASRSVDLIGVDNIMFESDYPHSDSNWPSSRMVLEKMLANVPDDVARKIAEDNARRLYNFPRSS